MDNRQHIDATQGKILIDGNEVTDGVTFTVVFTPIVQSTKTLGHSGDNSRWTGFRISGVISEYRSSPWLLEKIKEFKEKGITPEFVVQGIVTDESSDYFKEYGGQSITVTGCVPSGDITLFNFDANATNPIADNIPYTGKDFVLKARD